MRQEMCNTGRCKYELIIFGECICNAKPHKTMANTVIYPLDALCMQDVFDQDDRYILDEDFDDMFISEEDWYL